MSFFGIDLPWPLGFDAMKEMNKRHHVNPQKPVMDIIDKPFVWIGNKLVKADHMVDNVLDGTANVIGAAGSAAGALDDILAGRSHILLYAGIGLVTIIVLPIVLNKVL